MPELNAVINDLTTMALALTGEQRRAITVLARLAARNAIRRKLQAQGRKVTLIPLAEIAPLADHYLQQHPELLCDAALSPIVQAMRPSCEPQHSQLDEMGMVQR